MRLKTALLALAIVLLAVNAAWACYPTITANAFCDPATKKPMINFTSTSWSTVSPEGLNPQIDILFNNSTVFSAPYEAPSFSFTKTLPAPDGSGAGSMVAVEALAVGIWGNGVEPGQSASVTVTIPDVNTDPNCVTPALGRFTGGGHQITLPGNVKITRGFTLHCDILLSNNLEVNWNGNSFHMTEYPSSVTCSDDPAINPIPPPAPVDTITGISTGRYDPAGSTPAADGYTIEFTFKDAGEPGTSGPDQAALKIYEKANPSNVVLDIPLQPITGGNIQAHYDQPHM